MKIFTALAGASIAALVTGGGVDCGLKSDKAPLTPSLFRGDFQKLVVAAIALNKPAFIPCGTYDHLPALNISVPNRQAFVMRGESRECVILGFTGNGVLATFQGVNSSVDVEDLTFATTDTRGRYTALQLHQGFINPNPALSATSQVARVTFRGAPATVEPYPYWANGFIASGVSNINLDSLTYGGNGAGRGNGLIIQGYKPDAARSANDSYAVSINVTNYISYGCDSGIIRGDMVQGLAVINGQATGCHYGLAVPGNTIGENDQVHIRGGQWADDRYGISCVDPHTAHMIVEGGYYITVGAATAIQSCGEIPIVTHNTIGGNGSPKSVGIDITAPSQGNNALIEANSIRGLGVGIKEEAGIRSPVALVNNQISDTTLDYLIDPTDRETIIVDHRLRSLSSIAATVPCQHSVSGATFTISDGKNPTFMGVITGGGNRTTRVMCDGSLGAYVAY